ncbi:hypothetical protein G6L37_01515 [Agrobacterium rubi]|nr:hypothetical protein [Agrobacterium rubi]NTF24071.1 hypothetical protein [Agrobacterium rubi]
MSNRETTISNAVNTDDATKEAAEYFMSTDEDMMTNRYSWHRGIDLEDIDFEDEETREDYEEYVSDYAAEQVYGALAELCWSIEEEEGRVSIWRSMTVPADYLENGIEDRPLGIYWAFKEDAAEAHYGDFSKGLREIVLKGVVRLDDIDWQRSLTVNAHSEEEKELRLKDTAIVHVVSATWPSSKSDQSAITVELDLELPAGTPKDLAFAEDAAVAA